MAHASRLVQNKKSELNILKEELIEQKMRKVLYAVKINLHVLYAILHIQVLLFIECQTSYCLHTVIIMC